MASFASLLTEGIAGARVLLSLTALLRQRVRPEEARAALREGLEHRAERFLKLAREQIYARPESPYRRLLEHVGVELGDLEALVGREGLEGALSELARRGVYLEVAELKGARPVRRGSLELRVTPEQLQSDRQGARLAAQSSGSSGSATPVSVNLAAQRAQADNHYLVLEASGGLRLRSAYGGLGWRHAHWGVPGSSALGRMAGYAVVGARQERWFSHVDPADPSLHPRYRWSGRALRLASLLAGNPLPAAETVTLEDPSPIVRWMRQVLREGDVPNLFTFPSSAVRICLAAQRAGEELQGAQFTVMGEPLTSARAAAIERSGATVVPRYGSVESGIMAYGCLRPEVAGELHLASDAYALVTSGDVSAQAALPPGGLLVTSLRQTPRLVLLNVSLGDQGQLERRDCGCPLEALGWSTHLRDVGSFARLNTGGIAILDLELARILDDVLPAAFGGEPTDYQLIETETAEGEPDLVILADPAIGPLDELVLVERFCQEVGRAGGAQQLAVLGWRQLGLPRVERRSPIVTSSGKIRHLLQGAAARRTA